MQNFWEKPRWEGEDLHLSELKAAPFRRALPVLNLGPGLFIIRGPRQVGKSSWLKTAFSKVVKEHGPDHAFFSSCENLRDHLDLSELLKKTQERRFVFLDEVTFVKDWSRAVKHVMDTQKNKVLVLSGSNAVDLRRGADTMPGRHRAGGTFTLLPMSFAEFTQARRDAKWIDRHFNRKEELKNYFRVGGFPAAVIEAGAKANKPLRAMETYARWLVGDAVKFGKNETYFKELFVQVLSTSQSSLSLQTLAKRTQMGSHHTALDYLNIAEDSFALTQIYAIDPNTGAKRLRKDKKFYFRDPLIYAIANEWAGEIVSETKLTEMAAEAVACEHFIQRGDRFGYFHSPKGEVDFYAHKKWALEVKWSSSTSNLSRVFKDLQMPWKELWDPSNFLVDFPPLDQA